MRNNPSITQMNIPMRNMQKAAWSSWNTQTVSTVSITTARVCPIMILGLTLGMATQVSAWAGVQALAGHSAWAGDHLGTAVMAGVAVHFTDSVTAMAGDSDGDHLGMQITTGDQAHTTTITDTRITVADIMEEATMATQDAMHPTAANVIETATITAAAVLLSAEMQAVES